MNFKNINPRETFDIAKRWWVGDIKNRALVICLLAGAILATWTSGETHPPTEERSAEGSIDTIIPAGFLLVPIEILNFESLDSVLGKFGVVDLYATDGSTQKKVAERVKILRAPLNPRHFAVLVREEIAPALARNPGPFFVAVQNPKQRGTRLVVGRQSTKRVFFGGEP